MYHSNAILLRSLSVLVVIQIISETIVVGQITLRMRRQSILVTSFYPAQISLQLSLYLSPVAFQTIQAPTRGRTGFPSSSYKVSCSFWLLTRPSRWRAKACTRRRSWLCSCAIRSSTLAGSWGSYYPTLFSGPLRECVLISLQLLYISSYLTRPRPSTAIIGCRCHRVSPETSLLYQN